MTKPSSAKPGDGTRSHAGQESGRHGSISGCGGTGGRAAGSGAGSGSGSGSGSDAEWTALPLVECSQAGATRHTRHGTTHAATARVGTAPGIARRSSGILFGGRRRCSSGSGEAASRTGTQRCCRHVTQRMACAATTPSLVTRSLDRQQLPGPGGSSRQAH